MLSALAHELNQHFRVSTGEIARDRMGQHHCQKFGTRWRLRVRTKAIMAAKSYKEMYGNKETFSNISIMSLRVFGARLETC